MISKIENLANELMETPFEYNGITYNMKSHGWDFSFNIRKRSAGLCKITTKTIQLSKWVIENSDETMDFWRNTLLHEIAHGIDVMKRGTSSHDYKWRNIAVAIGCDGNRTCNVNLLATRKSKYTLKCKKCGYEIPSHKRKKTLSSCGKCSPVFDERYLLEQFQNY